MHGKIKTWYYMNCSLINSISACVFFLATIPVFAQNTYHIEYETECSFALDFYEENKSEFERQSAMLGLESAFLFSIVAPEVSQYGQLSNTVETYSLKVLYVQYGKGYADFSIGHFQMKPSFIEDLEKYIAANNELKSKYNHYLFKQPDNKNARIERVDRLNSLSWQINYLTAFCDVILHKFKNILFISDTEKVKFFAAAYNSGFHKSENELKKMQKLKYFPRFGVEKYNYSDITNWFFLQI